MTTQTSNFGLTKPEASERYDISVVQNTFIDEFPSILVDVMDSIGMKELPSSEFGTLYPTDVQEYLSSSGPIPSDLCPSRLNTPGMSWPSKYGRLHYFTLFYFNWDADVSDLDNNKFNIWVYNANIVAVNEALDAVRSYVDSLNPENISHDPNKLELPNFDGQVEVRNDRIFVSESSDVRLFGSV